MKRRLFMGVLFAVLAFDAHAEEWYQGGTLHNATAREWQAARADNRLATTADFVASLKAASNMTELKTRAQAVQKCITESTKDPSLYHLQVSEVAVACITLLEYEKQPSQ